MLNVVTMENIFAYLLGSGVLGNHSQLVAGVEHKDVLQSGISSGRWSTVTVKNDELIAMDVDRMEPASAAIPEPPYLGGVQLHRSVNAVRIKELAIDLPCALAPLELKCPGNDGFSRIKDRESFQNGRHGAVVSD